MGRRWVPSTTSTISLSMRYLLHWFLYQLVTSGHIAEWSSRLSKKDVWIVCDSTVHMIGQLRHSMGFLMRYSPCRGFLRRSVYSHSSADGIIYIEQCSYRQASMCWSAVSSEKYKFMWITEELSASDLTSLFYKGSSSETSSSIHTYGRERTST